MPENNDNTRGVAAMAIITPTPDNSAAANLSKKDHIEEESADAPFGWKQKGQPTMLVSGQQSQVKGGSTKLG
ncbi:hypothetical protein FIBSPDRAFT_879220 [Athelia psychrophila]|uniref:Uncharacterized protein n=1 Tax=Athelia psychrophila TaxID=1759441 RepID=A0A167U8S5_9AGAM|nr:hypothetical protein FIBSPDRAFT_879220 [Fibularhizoctonia sp. CBS 109695]